MWEASCECGNTTFVLGSAVAKGNTTSCGCALSDHRSEFGMKNRIYDPIVSSARTVWKKSYSDGDVTFEDFFHLSQLPCEYCGIQPYKVFNAATKALAKAKKGKRAYISEYQIKEGNFVYNGLDRIDSSKGHMLDNVVPCCYPCNWQKMNMTTEQFIRHNARQYLHMAPLRAKLF